jgi:hypothetical protein
VLQRPDPQSFSRFLASIGFFLCVAGVVGPTLILRETSVLEIKQQDLAQLTDVGKAELERRQRAARDFAKAAPIAGGVFFLFGVGLMLYATPQMRRQERRAEQRSDVELEELRKRLPPQTEAQREAHIQDEVAAEWAGPRELASPTAPPGPPPLDEAGRSRAEHHAGVEQKVLDRLARIASPLYELRAHVRLEPSGIPLDAVLVSTIEHLPDLIVDIKLRRPGSFAKYATNVIDETLAHVGRYRAVVSPAAKGWLVVVFDGEISDALRDRIRDASADVLAQVHVSAVREEEIETLDLPPGPWR